jgi:hypothetical protein
MKEYWSFLGQDVTPANHDSIGQGNELNVLGTNVAENELPDGFNGRRFKKSQVFMLTSNPVEDLPKALDVLFADCDDLMFHGRFSMTLLPRALSAPLLGRCDGSGCSAHFSIGLDLSPFSGPLLS